MSVHNYHYTIQETDLDFLGHVNNANYVRILEQARWDLISGRNYSIQKINELKKCPIVLSINIKYIKELKARIDTTIKTEFDSYEGKIGTLKQEIIINDTGDVACSAVITYGLFDMISRKLIPPPQEWLDTITTA